ncbi:MAG: glycosyltransferase [Sphingobacteriaceae bacterium]|nr:MAG: glycosyltransferase [Sphingobacteriaceae bacterium]
MKKLLIHAWRLEKDEDGYYITTTHYTYLTEIIKYYSEVCLLSPVKILAFGTRSKLTPIGVIANLTVHELPYSGTYLSSVKHFPAYSKAYRHLASAFDRVYVRYPTPFGWLSRYYFKDIIIHFVGDPVDTTLANPNFSPLKRKLLVQLFRPEEHMFLQACKKARVFTNGYHIKERLHKKRISAQAVISSTLGDNDVYFGEDNTLAPDNVKLLYTGYLRKAKGIETLIHAFDLLLKEYPKATFTIVGTGEFETELKALVYRLGLEKVIAFTGHINSRSKLNELYRAHSLFCFASLSEGSPRVILEAMANGINVLSTPVGSLPTIFEHGKNIVFAEAGNPRNFAEKMSSLIGNSQHALSVKTAAFNKAKSYTTASFIKTIFE